jgi:hypothetical protein
MARREAAVATSISYRATRVNPLSPAERTAIDTLVGQYAGGPNGEALRVSDSLNPSHPRVIFEGATDATDDDLGYWCAVLSEIRRVLADATWQVLVDGRAIPWNEDCHEYEPRG